MSDGTPTLRFLDPDTLETEETLTVMLNGEPLRYLNELEWIDGEIYSNVWTTNVIVRIDPDSGNVTSVIDLSGLLPSSDREGRAYRRPERNRVRCGQGPPVRHRQELAQALRNRAGRKIPAEQMILARHCERSEAIFPTRRQTSKVASSLRSSQ